MGAIWMVVVQLSLISKADRYGLLPAYNTFSAGSKGTFQPSVREKNVEILRCHIKSAPSPANSMEYAFKHFSIHRYFESGSPKVSLLWSSSNRQLLSYLANQVIDGFFSSWNKRKDSVSFKQQTPAAVQTNSIRNRYNLPFSEDWP